MLIIFRHFRRAAKKANKKELDDASGEFTRIDSADLRGLFTLDFPGIHSCLRISITVIQNIMGLKIHF